VRNRVGRDVEQMMGDRNKRTMRQWKMEN